MFAVLQSRIRTVIALIAISLLVFVEILRASDVPANPSNLTPVNVADIAAKLTSYFQAIKSIEIKIETGDPGKKDKTLHWFENGDKYRYDWAQLNPQMPLAHIGAYDGQQYQQLEPKSGILYLSQKPFESRTMRFLETDTFFTTPFEWLIPRTLENKETPIKIIDLKSPDGFLKVLRSATNIVRTTKNSHSVIQLTLPGGFDWVYKKPYNYRVYFSTDQDDFPIGWDKIDADGKMLSAYHITELGQIKINDQTTIYYPEKVSEGYFASEDIVDDSYWGKPRVRITFLSVNNINDDVFTIDPSIARGIYESDKQKYIAVPK